MNRGNKLQELKLVDEQLKNIFYDIEHPASFGSVSNLSKSVKKVEKQKVDDWLREQDTYTLHVANRRKYKTNHYLLFGANELFELDLIDLKNIGNYNFGYKYILCVIDCFTKYLWAVPLTNKSAQKTTDAFKSIIESSGVKPQAINVDRGSEFNNHIFKAYLSKVGIQLNFPYIQSYQKAAIIERTIKFVKEKIFKYFSSRGPNYRKYIDILPSVIKSYNNKIHSTTKVAPANFQVKDTVAVYRNIKKRVTRYDKQALPKLKKLDFVRIIRKKSVLEHGFTQRWTREIFRVHQVIYKNPIPLYKLTDLEGTPITGKFYEKQLLKIIMPADVPFNIINTRKTRRNVQYEVETGDGSRIWMSKDEYDKTKKQ